MDQKTKNLIWVLGFGAASVASIAYWASWVNKNSTRF